MAGNDSVLMMDLRAHPPRRSSDSLAGFIWLPRLLDKVRAFQAGTLGAYAYPSMLDRSYMRLFGFTPAFIEQAVREQQSDVVIATSIQTHIGLTDDEIFALSRRFHRTYRVALHMLDRDDGYASGIGYPLPRFLQTPVWRWYQRWAARKASADAV